MTRLLRGALVAAIALAAVGVGGPVTDAGAEAVPRQAVSSYPRTGFGGPELGATVTVMSFNACGGVCRRGEVRRTASFIAATAARRDASVVLLQELCRGQFLRVRALLAPQGYRARFAAQTHSKACGGGFGVAVLVRGRISGTVVRRLPTRPGFEPRLMLGTTADVAGRRTFVAAVHLSPTRRAGLDQQLAALDRLLRPRLGGPVIVGGDFNAMPDHAGMGRFYAADGGGPFTELDERHGGGSARRGGEPTFDLFGRKIDYVFASGRWFGRPRARALATTMSDHRVYVGSVRVRSA